ncbi:MAG: vWA domain-containing protein [Alphaproteobacteria bacterium]
MWRRTAWSALGLWAVVLALAAPPAAGQGAGAPAPARAAMKCSPAPLLQKGKTQLLERVLVRPGAKLAATADGVGQKPVLGFSVLFVYDHSADGKAVQVGARSDCRPDGWLPNEAVVPWEHTMVASFADRTGRERVLFFRDDGKVKALIKSADAGEEAAKMRAAAAGGAGGEVVSIEPEKAVDISKQFYLLPILEAKPQRYPDGKLVRVLRVAAVTSQDKGAPAPPPAVEKPEEPNVRRNFRACIVFLVDATKSTQPYIDRVRQSLDRVYGHIEEAKLQDRVRFGLIAYRDDPKYVPGIEYGTKVFVDPNKVSDRKTFDELAAQVKSSKISSRAESEDGYAGVNAAINGIDWENFAARYIVMVTDASSRGPETGVLSSTKYDAKRLRLMAQEKKHIAIFVLHLITREGSRKDHEKGKEEYTELTAYPGRSPLYYPVPGGDIKILGDTVDRIAEAIVGLVRAAEEGKDLLVPQRPPGEKSVPGKEVRDPLEDVAAIGHAMRLAYLGSVAGTRAPSMFEAWTSDRDFANPTIADLDIRVLLTKAQLSDLAATVSALIDAYEKGKIDPSNLYAQLRSAALTLSRDPNKIGAASNRDLKKEILGEYLQGLPYMSKVMAIDQEDWTAMSPGEQQTLIDDLSVKLLLYRRFHDDVTKWVALAEGAAPEDAVYAVPLEALP